MEQLNNTPSEPPRKPSENLGVSAPQTADQALETVTQDLKRLHQDLIGQVTQDIARLQAEKSQLLEEIEKLRRDRQELQSQTSAILVQRLQAADALEAATPSSEPAIAAAGSKLVPPPSAQGAQEPPTVSSPVAPATKQASQVQVGLLLVLLSSVALSFHNVVVKIIFREQTVLGLGTLGGVITPGLGNSLLILWMRMLIVVPMLAAIAGFLYPPMWSDLKRFLLARDRSPLWTVMSSGGFLFLSQVLIYLALAQIPAGTAITIFFIYPTITVLLAWKVFGDRPTLFRVLVMLVICLGGVLALPQVTGGPSGNAFLGSLAAAGSGIAFAGYVILTGLCTRKLNPVPVSLIQFMTIFVLSSVVLMLPLPALSIKMQPTMWPGFMVSCLVLGAATLLGYLCTNIGIRLIGPAPASIISATGPAFTAILAFLIIQDQLQSQQWIGVILVTLGVAGLNFERMRGQILKPKAS